MKKCVSVWLSLACYSIFLQLQSITLMAYAMSCFETKMERHFFVALNVEQDLRVMWYDFVILLVYSFRNSNMSSSGFEIGEGKLAGTRCRTSLFSFTRRR